MEIIHLVYLIDGLIYGLLLFLRPRIATGIVIFLCIFQFGWFTRYFGSTDYLGRIIYFFALLLAARILVDFITQQIEVQRHEKISHSILLFIFGFTTLIAVSNIYNQESFILGFYELRYYFIMVTLFFAIYYYSVLPVSLESFIIFFICIGILQIPFAIIQFALAGGGTYRTLDSVTGTFSSYYSLVFITLLDIGLLLNYKMESNQNLFRFNSYYLVFLLIIPLLLSKSRTGTGLVLFMIALAYMWASIRKKTNISLIKGTVLMILFTFLVGSLFYNFFWKPRYDIKTQFSLGYIYSYFMRESRILKPGVVDSMGRARSVQEASKLISRNFLTMLLGRGSGSVSDASLLGMHGRYYSDFGPLVGIGRTQVSKVIAENGLIGLFLFSYLFFSIWKSTKLVEREKGKFGTSFIIILITILILSLYGPILQSPISALGLSYFFALVQTELNKQQEISP
jgi:hypothetical protein